MSEGTQDVVARLRARKTRREFDNWGMYVDVSHSPSDLDFEAADALSALSDENTRLREAVTALLEFEPVREEFPSTRRGGYQFEIAKQVFANARAALSPAAEPKEFIKS